MSEEKAAKKRATAPARFAGLQRSVVEVFASVSSKDPETRKMAFRFLLSCAGVVAVAWLTIVRVQHARSHLRHSLTRSESDAKHLSSFMRRRAEEAWKKGAQLNLGDFSLELKAPEGEPKKIPGVLNMAETELIIDCDSPATKNFIEEHLIQVRDEITAVFVGVERDDIFTRDGKIMLKKKLVDRLNLWLDRVSFRGKVEHLYINKLIVS